MLLGTWELELTEIWERILANDYSLMVDVGAAEGYYAVGMNLRKPNAEVIAYEDYVANNGEQGAKDAGKWRLEGKDYRMQEGDVVHFRFNV